MKNPAQAGRVERRVRLFAFPWMVERARILHRICLAIQRRIERGDTVREAFKQARWYWRKPRYYRNDRTRRVQIGGSLTRFYYHWRNSGEAPDCFTLNYQRRYIPVSRAVLVQFIGACARRGCLSMSGAGRDLGWKGNFWRIVVMRLPDKARRVILAAQRERRELRQQVLAKETSLSRRIRFRAEMALGRSGVSYARLAGPETHSEGRTKAFKRVLSRSQNWNLGGVHGGR